MSLDQHCDSCDTKESGNRKADNTTKDEPPICKCFLRLARNCRLPAIVDYEPDHSRNRYHCQKYLKSLHILSANVQPEARGFPASPSRLLLDSLSKCAFRIAAWC